MINYKCQNLNNAFAFEGVKLAKYLIKQRSTLMTSPVNYNANANGHL